MQRPAVFSSLLPVALIALAGGFCFGILGGRVADILYAPANAPTPWGGLLPDPIAFLLGLGGFGVAAFWLSRAGVSHTARGGYFELKSRLEKKGLLIGAAALHENSLSRSEEEQGLAALCDRFVSQIAADRAEVEKYKDALAKYIDPSLASKLKHESNYTQVPSRRVSVAVMFTDIRGFTKMSETLSIEEVVRILNDYFSFAAEIIKKNHGQINKFIGDAVMAFFDDPAALMSGFTGCQNAIEAGLEISSTFRRKVPIWKEKTAAPFEADLGVGIHFGPVIMGNLGSPERMEYTAIGDTVNFTSRLCGLAKGGQVRVSQEAYNLVKDYYEASPMEPVSVKGKSGEYTTYLVTGKKGIRW